MPFVESHQARISYTVDGQLGGPPLLLIMGLGGSSAEWGSDFLEQLARHFQVACMDNRGVGESTTCCSFLRRFTCKRIVLATLDAVSSSL